MLALTPDCRPEHNAVGINQVIHHTIESRFMKITTLEHSKGENRVTPSGDPDILLFSGNGGALEPDGA
jgi:hypothetical protein